MPGLNRRELTNKPLRMDVRMARDIESLSDYTSYSQNEIILMAVKRYLYENRGYFVADMISDIFADRIERETVTMHGDIHIQYGAVTIDMTRNKSDMTEPDKDNSYTATIQFRNKHGDVFYEDSRPLDIFDDKEWQLYKAFLDDIIMKYVDLDDPDVKAYFKQKFLYE